MMKKEHIQDNIYMVIGWLGNSSLCYDFETRQYTIQVNEHDHPDRYLQRGLAEIRSREEKIHEWEQRGGAAV